MQMRGWVGVNTIKPANELWLIQDRAWWSSGHHACQDSDNVSSNLAEVLKLLLKRRKIKQKEAQVGPYKNLVRFILHKRRVVKGINFLFCVFHHDGQFTSNKICHLAIHGGQITQWIHLRLQSCVSLQSCFVTYFIFLL